MQLIGMLDSPYVRRVALTLQLLGLRFEHRSLSVFRAFEAFSQINPVVKAPTLVCDDGEVLMDSTLIIEYAESLAQPRSLMPAERAERQHALRVIGLALAACEKSVAIVYERALCVPEKRDQPWMTRVHGQLLAACDALERECLRRPLAATRSEITQAGVTAAVTWRFIREVTPTAVPADRCPALAAFCAQAEALPEFRAAPHGDGTFVAGT